MMRSTAATLSTILGLSFVLILGGCPPVSDDDDSAAADDDDATSDDDDATPDYGEAPTASVQIVPAAPRSSDVLLAAVTSSDPEGAAVVVTVRWTKDGQPVAALDDQIVVPAGATASGEEWTVTVVPNDGGQDGAAATDSVTINDQRPVLFAVSIAPAAPAEGDDVLATPGGTFDPDGDAVTISYVWMVNGADSGVTGDTLTSADFGRGDTIQVVATPNDGSDDGAAVASNTVTVVNTAPTATGVTVDPTSGFEDTTFTCSGQGFDDVDGDAEGWTYSWVVNGVFDIPGDSIDGASFNRGDYLVCQGWATDGELASAMVSSTPIQVSNTAPTLADAAITPAVPTSSDMLTAVPGGPADLDGDGVSFHYAWTVDGAPAGEDLPILPASEFARGALVAVELTPTDGTDEGTPVMASAVTIGNSAPSFAGVDLVYDPATGSFAATGLGWSDVDGDAEGYTYEWSNGAGLLSETGASLATSVLAAPDTVSVALTANDGIDDGNTLSSDTLDFGPILVAGAPRVDFGVVNGGCQVGGALTIENQGTTSLTISDLTLVETLGSGFLSAPAASLLPLTIAPGVIYELAIEVDAFEVGEFTADLEITSDDPVQPSLVVPVTGEVVEPLLYEERFYGGWNTEPYVLSYVPWVIPTVILDNGGSTTDFTYDSSINAIQPGYGVGTGEVTAVSYLPSDLGCVDNLAPVVVASLVPATPSSCVATEIDLSGSFDPDGDAFDYGFSFPSVPTGSAVDGGWVSQGDASASVVTDVSGDYLVVIDATDVHGATGAPVGVAFVGVDQAPQGGIGFPVADAGPDMQAVGTARCFQIAYGGLECSPCVAAPIRLDGSASVDPDGTGLSYSWSLLNGDLEIRDGGNSATPLVGIPASVGSMVGLSRTYGSNLRLTVSDCDGNEDSSDVSVVFTCAGALDQFVGVQIRD